MSAPRAAARLARRTLLAAPAAAFSAARRASAQAAPVRIIVPYTPGAFNDTLARVVGDGMQNALGQPGVVENRPGRAAPSASPRRRRRRRTARRSPSPTRRT
jgi:ABC-type sugar transport system substrate-binding protein